MAEPARCRSCGATVQWVHLVTGGTMPVDLIHQEIPAASMVGIDTGAMTGRVLTVVEAAALAGRVLPVGKQVRTSHWATCPSAERHRVSAQQEGLF